MVERNLRRGLIGLLLGLGLLAGCVPRTGVQADADSASLPAVESLLDSAQIARASGRHDDAAADLERALRLQPENAYLWHELAAVRREQGEWTQAISLAQRSNGFAEKDLQKANWRLIAQCRRAMGDEAGALEAEERADGL